MVEGFGEDFLPSTLDLSLIDEVIRVSDRECFQWARRLVKEEALFCGGSSGAALAAAVRYLQARAAPGEPLDPPQERLAVVILPDSGTRYLSKFYDDGWMQEHGFLEPENQATQAIHWLELPAQTSIYETIEHPV